MVRHVKYSRADAAGKKPCKGTKIAKGEARLGVWVEIQGHGSFKWRHWGCEPVITDWKAMELMARCNSRGLEQLESRFQRRI